MIPFLSVMKHLNFYFFFGQNLQVIGSKFVSGVK